MAGRDSRGGSRASTPRVNAADGPSRTSMISDIESGNGDTYHSLSRTNSFFSADSSLQRGPYHSHSPAPTIRPPLPLSPPPIPALHGPLGSDSPHGSGEATPQGRIYPEENRLTIDSLRLSGHSSVNSSLSTLDLGTHGDIVICRESISGDSLHEHQSERADSPSHRSGDGSPDSTIPLILPCEKYISPVVPPRVLPRGPPLHIQTQDRPSSSQSLEVRGRQESSQTASSYAMFSPSSRNSQIVEEPNEKALVAAEPPTPLRIPPHAVEAIRSNQPRPPAHYFHGPPPVHGADSSPPVYDTREATQAVPTLTRNHPPQTWSEKVGLLDPTDDDRSKPWWRRRKGYCFWIIVGLVGFIVVVLATVGIVVGKEIKQRKPRHNEQWSAANATGMPPIARIFGSWTYTTNLTTTTTGCAPTANGASNDLWRCSPYDAPPVPGAVWNFEISAQQKNSTTGSNSTEEVEQLMISSGSNLFDTRFSAKPLYLLQYAGTTYYQFTFNYTRTSTLTINGNPATCEFPNTVFTAMLYVNSTLRRWKHPAAKGSLNRGEWPGNVSISETKVSGGRQVVCRDNATMDVVQLNPVTPERGGGDCLCQYQNF